MFIKKVQEHFIKSYFLSYESKENLDSLIKETIKSKQDHYDEFEITNETLIINLTHTTEEVLDIDFNFDPDM